MHFKRSNPAGLSGKVPKNPHERRSNPKLTCNPHKGESREYNVSPIHYITESYLIITNQVLILRKVLEVQNESSSEFNCSGNKRVLNDDTRCHDEARTWHHSALSSLAGVVSHSTDQPGGKVHGQVKLAIWSSNISPENKVEPQVRLSILILSKPYPTMGILSPLPRHARLLAGGFVSPKSN